MTEHLVAFEYGTGRIWGYIRARSAAEITRVVPEVDVYNRPPSWMGEGDVRLLRERAVYLSQNALDSILHRKSPTA